MLLVDHVDHRRQMNDGEWTMGWGTTHADPNLKFTDDRGFSLVVVAFGLVITALLVLWVGALQIMLDKGNELDWFASGSIVALSATAVA